MILLIYKNLFIRTKIYPLFIYKISHHLRYRMVDIVW